MRISAAFPSKYLKAADLQAKQVTVVMSHVTMETIGDDERPVLYFKGKDKGLVVNKTNANTIAEAFGDDTQDWRDGEIVLFEASVEFQGKMMPGIRCRVPPRKPEPKPTEMDDDDIPF
jgi:hypothetical protein